MNFFKTKLFLWNRKSQIIFLENMEMYLSVGLTLDESLRNIMMSVPVKFRKDIEQISMMIEHGQNLSKGLSLYMHLPPSLVGLIEHGEKSGELQNSIRLAKSIIEKEELLIKTCISALIYPSVIAVFACILTIGLMKIVMPQISPLLLSLHVQLPIITRIAIYLSDHLTMFSIYFAILLFVLYPLIFLLYKKIYIFKKLCHTIILSLPIIGKMFRLYSLSMLFRSFGGLINSGAKLVDAYEYSVDRISLISIREIFVNKVFLIKSGANLSSVFFGFKFVPNYVLPLLKAGETSGTLGSALSRISDFIDRDIEQSIKRITSLIEPAMMIGVGLIVGGIALSIMMPIYEVSKVLQR